MGNSTSDWDKLVAEFCGPLANPPAMPTETPAPPALAPVAEAESAPAEPLPQQSAIPVAAENWSSLSRRRQLPAAASPPGGNVEVRGRTR